jgi:hypothetical protein
MVNSIVELSGHIVDSLILPKVLDLIITLGGEFEILEVQVGHRRTDRSYAKISIEGRNRKVLDHILARIKEHGALPVEERNEPVELAPAPMDGVFPENFYATTNLLTQVRFNDQWLDVQSPEMDCGIRVDRGRAEAETIPIHRVKKGDSIVVGHRGVKVLPLERQISREVFEFMSSPVSTERPKGLLIREIAESMK